MTFQSISLSSADLTIDVSALGAELRSLRTRDDVEYLWQGDEATWPERSPLLFPVIGLPRDGQVWFEGRPYPIERHGFARARDFEIAAVAESSARFRLTDSAETLVSFPYAFELAVTYVLVGATLTIEVVVANRETARAMPFCFGFHPGFGWPLPGNKDKSGHTLDIVSAAPAFHLHRLVGGRLMGEAVQSWPGKAHLPLDESLFLPSAMILEDASPREVLYRGAAGSSIRVVTENFQNLGLWSKSPGRFVCIEPWSALPQSDTYSGDLAGRADVTVLPPGEQTRFAMHITITGPQPAV